jgi:hypothetical protein
MNEGVMTTKHGNTNNDVKSPQWKQQQQLS